MGGYHGPDYTGSFMRSCKEIIFSAQRHWADAVLHRIIIYVQHPVFSISRQGIPSFNTVGQGFTDIAFWQCTDILFFQPFTKCFKYRQGPFLAYGFYFTGGQPFFFTVSFYGIKLLYFAERIFSKCFVIFQCFSELTPCMCHAVYLPDFFAPVKVIIYLVSICLKISFEALQHLHRSFPPAAFLVI